MKLIVFCIVVCSASALPPLPPSSETPREEGLPSPNSVENEIQAVLAIFEALSKLSQSAGVQTDQNALLDKLRDIALAAAADRDLPQEEKNRKYSAATLDALEEHACSLPDGEEKNQFLAAVAKARRNAQSLAAVLVPDKVAFIDFLRRLHEVASEPFPGDKRDPLPDKDFEEFIKALEVALEHSTLLS